MSSRRLSIIVPAAGQGIRMGDIGPKSLLPIGEETIISRALRILRNRFPFAQIIVVGGHEFKKLEENLPCNVKLVINKNYQFNNVGASIKCGIEEALYENILIVYGDLIFEESVFDVSLEESALWVDTFGTIKSSEVGLVCEHCKVLNMSYGLPHKWCQLALLKSRELAIMLEQLQKRTAGVKFGFELINEVLERGGKFNTISSPSEVFEIDFNRDLLKAQRFLKERDDED